MIIGSWKVTDVVFSDSAKQYYKPQAIQIITKQLKTLTLFTFLPDCNIRFVMPDKTITGRWYLSADRKILHVLPEDGNSGSATLEGLTNKTFTLLQDDVAGHSIQFKLEKVPDQ